MLQLIEPVQKQIILLKLVDLLDNTPDFPGTGTIAGESPQRQWISRTGALLKKVDPIGHVIKFEKVMNALGTSRVWAINQIKGQMMDAIEVLRLDLELEGRSDIGNVYEAGEVYKLFSDLKKIIGAASEGILVVDPYFNGKAFDDYLSTIGPGKTIKILASRYVNDVQTYAAKHAQQYGTIIEIRRSREPHDRLVIVDNSDCWVVGGSIKDAAVTSPTYLLPLQPELARRKLAMYSAMWDRAESRE